MVYTEAYMGRKSTKENKNIYQLSREAASLSRSEAQQVTYLSPDRIADIENDKLPHADEVVAMAEGYKDPFLCNYYCAKECAIGCNSVTIQEKHKSLTRISIEMLNVLNYLDEEKKRFMEIVEDEQISLHEIDEFQHIQERFQKMESVIDAFQLWVKQYELNGQMPEKNERLL